MAGSLKSKDRIDIVRDPAEAKTFTSLLQALRPDRGRWDMVACTDGSGSTDALPGGYAAVMVYRRQKGIHVITGSASNCTSQGAEVRALYELANFLVATKVGHTDGGYCVQLVTDSQYVATSLSAINADPVRALATKSHRLQWIAIQYAARVGIRFTPHYIARNSNPLMTLADSASKAARLAFDAAAIETLRLNAELECEASFPLSVASTQRRR